METPKKISAARASSTRLNEAGDPSVPEALALVDLGDQVKQVKEYLARIDLSPTERESAAAELVDLRAKERLQFHKLQRRSDTSSQVAPVQSPLPSGGGDGLPDETINSSEEDTTMLSVPEEEDRASLDPFGASDPLALDQQTEEDPFSEVPGLEDLGMPGMWPAIGKKEKEGEPLPSLMTNFWKEARGGERCRQVATSGVLRMYSKGGGAQAFAGPSVPGCIALPRNLQDQDFKYKDRQNIYGCAARAALQTVLNIRNIRNQIQALDLPPQARQQLAPLLAQIGGEAVVPLSHNIRLLAACFNSCGLTRFNNAISTVTDKQAKEELREGGMGFETLFTVDPQEVVRGAVQRENQRLVAQALQRTNKQEATQRQRQAPKADKRPFRAGGDPPKQKNQQNQRYKPYRQQKKK